uniref:(northern house mosquito) hypothetical protein n=1 Tax=Culex pipiens TaxID=7175 RepID=A0A8D7ZV36_CULPI
MCPSKFAKLPLSKSKWKQKVRVIDDDDDDVNNNIIVMVISVEYRSVGRKHICRLYRSTYANPVRDGVRRRLSFLKIGPKTALTYSIPRAVGPLDWIDCCHTRLRRYKLQPNVAPFPNPSPSNRPTDSCWMCHIV